MDKALEDLAKFLSDKMPVAISDWKLEHGELTLISQPEHLLSLMKILRDDPQCQFTCFIDMCGADYPEREDRFEAVYHLLSVKQNIRVRVKISTNGQQSIPSIVSLFPGANWFEREAYDFYGIIFEGHPDLRRLLTDYGFKGHPLRKDFPTTGYVEVRYDEEQKRVIYEPVKLAQDFRSFDFLSPWEGTDYVLPGDEKAENNEQAE